MVVMATKFETKSAITRFITLYIYIMRYSKTANINVKNLSV